MVFRKVTGVAINVHIHEGTTESKEPYEFYKITGRATNKSIYNAESRCISCLEEGHLDMVALIAAIV